MDDRMSVRNAWYAIALSDGISTSPVRRWAFEEPLVVYRGDDGLISVLSDACPHRNAPLSLGKLVNGHLQCPYHGFEFDRAGRCAAMPGQQGKPPSTLSVRAYPAVERFGIVWVWPGDAEAAEPSRLPDWPWHDDPEYRSLYVECSVEAPIEMVIDNLMDLTHVQFVHAFAKDLPVHNSSPMEVTVTDGRVKFLRQLTGGKYLSDKGEVADIPTYMEVSGEFLAPSAVRTAGVTKSFETGELADGPHRVLLHALTPEQPDRVRYILMRSWNRYHSDEEIAAAIAEDSGAIAEDKAIIEATWKNKKLLGTSARDHLVAIDQASVRSRRLYGTFSGVKTPDLLV